MAQWEYGKDIDYYSYKFKMAGISVLIGSERGTSSTCPECGGRHKPKGRTWNCPNIECSYKNKHRDLTGSLMMHVLAYSEKPQYPAQIKYLRPVNTGSSRCADTRQRSLELANISSTSVEGNHLISAQNISVV